MQIQALGLDRDLLKNQDAVQMVGHDHELVENGLGMSLRDLLPYLFTVAGVSGECSVRSGLRVP